MSDDIRRRLTDVDGTQSFDSVIVNDGAKMRQISKGQLEKLLNTDGVVEKVSGTSIQIRDSANAAFRGMKIFGKSTQKKTNGYQLFDASLFKTTTKGGATVKNNGDGSFTVSGSGSLSEIFTLAHNYYKVNGEKIFDALKAGTISISESPVYPRFYFSLYDSDENLLLEVNSQDRLSASITAEQVNNAARVRVSVYGGSGLDIVTGTIKPMVYIDGDGTWEEFSNGAASPSPNWPQEIESVENPEIRVYGKNLLKNTAKTTTHNGITFTVNDDGSVTANGTATDTAYIVISNDLTHLNVGKTYKMYGCPPGGSANSYFIQVNGTWNGDYGSGGAFEYKEIIKNFAIYVKSGVTVSNLTFYPMICFPEYTDNTYEQYKEPVIVNLSESLPGIPVASGGNYTDADGQQWICDEVDLERGVYIQRVNQFTPTKAENVTLLGNTTRFNTGLPINAPYDNGASFGYGLCSHLPFDNKYSKDTVHFYTQGTRAWIFLPAECGTTTEELTTYLVANPMTIYYQLAEPIETALTDEELEAYRSALTNYPNTTILNDAGAWMNIVYSVDLKKYITTHGGGGSSTVTLSSVTLSKDKWSESSDGTYYTQAVSIGEVTENTKVDLQPTPAQMVSLINDAISMFVANENGVIKVYAVGGTPSEDMTIQATKSEVTYI